jgi:hypothetical protein
MKFVSISTVSSVHFSRLMKVRNLALNALKQTSVI